MTRKHFEAVAATIRKEWTAAPSHEHPAISRIAQSMASTFAEVNPRFDRARFMDACRPA